MKNTHRKQKLQSKYKKEMNIPLNELDNNWINWIKE